MVRSHFKHDAKPHSFYKSWNDPWKRNMRSTSKTVCESLPGRRLEIQWLFRWHWSDGYKLSLVTVWAPNSIVTFHAGHHLLGCFRYWFRQQYCHRLHPFEVGIYTFGLNLKFFNLLDTCSINTYIYASKLISAIFVI